MQYSEQSRVEEQEELRRRENAVLASGITPQALAILQKYFANQDILIPGDPFATHYKLGQHEVVKFIEQALAEYKEA